jgi:hypothetical protein
VNIDNIRKGLIDPSNISDIFIHTWFDESVIGKPFQSAQPGQSGRLGVWEVDTLERLQSLHPKKIKAEKPLEFEQYNHLQGLPSAIQSHLASNTYSVYEANRLKSLYEKENGFVYDLVIRARIDCAYDQPYNIIDYLDSDWKNVLHVPYMYQVMRADDSYPINNGGNYSSLSDTFAYGSSDIMDKFCSVYPNFEKIHQKIYPYPYGECYFGYQVRHYHSLKISMQHIQYNLVRI